MRRIKNLAGWRGMTYFNTSRRVFQPTDAAKGKTRLDDCHR
jgi:hypothetical protein